jgi:TonB family protein
MMLLLDAMLRSSVVLLAGVAASLVLRRRPAARRHAVLAATVVAAAAVLPFSLVLPSWGLPRSVTSPPSQERAIESVAVAVAPAGTAPASVPASRPESLLIFTFVWAAGVIASLAMLLAGGLRVRLLGARATRVQDPRWRALSASASAAYGWRGDVEVLSSEHSDLTATWGVLRPRVLVPAAAMDWPADRIDLVLRHELAHVVRRDWLVQMAGEVLRSLYWCNPLAWVVCARLRQESEQACDDMVLAGGAAPADYAAHLLGIARECQRPGFAWGSAIPMARMSTLERRVAAMLNERADRKGVSRAAVSVALGFLLSVSLAAAAFTTAQTTPLPLVGVVYDTSGGVLPGVTITLTDADNVVQSAITNAAGRFEIPVVAPGQYLLEAAMPGFHKLQQAMNLGKAEDWDRAITLQVGQLREQVNVRAARLAPGAPQPGGPRPVRVGGNVRAPRKLVDVKPLYPESMQEAGREGSVPIEALIGLDGTVQSVRVLSADVHPDFATAAVDAVRQWQFSPTLLNGKPVEVVINVTVTFSLAE